MWILGFYRAYLSFCIGIILYILVLKSIWLLLASMILARIGWYCIERQINHFAINRDFRTHIYRFKQNLGPYGIRLANKAETDWQVKKSLSEVFTANRNKLKKHVEQLQMMDTLFKAGIQPDGDAYQLHDCKLAYGKFRLENPERPESDRGC